MVGRLRPTTEARKRAPHKAQEVAALDARVTSPRCVRGTKVSGMAAASPLVREQCDAGRRAERTVSPAELYMIVVPIGGGPNAKL